ncbi:MAG TPA: hypothetical protein VI758_05065 [Bacteroidota bacterium]
MKPKTQNMARNLAGSILLLVNLTSFSNAQMSSATQILTLSVKELNAIDLVGGEIDLQINRVSETTNQPLPAENAGSRLLWTSNGENRKITVATNNTAARFSLRIIAKNVSTSGSSATEVILNGDAPKDLIRSVSRSSGSCTIKYIAAADVSEGTGTEHHLVTYTITGG